MTPTDPTEQAQNAASAMKTIVDLAADHPEFKQAGTNLAKSAKTITSLIDNCLLPIAAVNYAFEKGKQYFAGQFKKDLQSVTEEIPADKLIEPKASIAAPILQGLTFAHEEPDLKVLFLNLLKSAMDSRTATAAHPAFVEVIRQLNSEEARLISAILNSADTLAIVQVRVKVENGRGYAILKNHVLPTFDTSTGNPLVVARMPSMVDNWIRLGLISVTYAEHLIDEARYEWVTNWPDLKDAKAMHHDKDVFFEKGLLRVTSFGREFSTAVK